MDLTTILIWIVVGAIAGWLAGLIVNKETGLSLRDIIIGIVGAFIGGFLYNQFGAAGAVTGINFTSILVALVGAIVLLLIIRLVTGTRRA